MPNKSLQTDGGNLTAFQSSTSRERPPQLSLIIMPLTRTGEFEMARWGDGFFEDDLAADVKAAFDEAVGAGKDPAKVAARILQTELAREILAEFAAEERDAMFWEENAGLCYAAAVL